MTQHLMREQLVTLLDGGNAHLSLHEAIRDLPVELRGQHVDGVPHSAWELLEHMRIAQSDILMYCLNPDYELLSWPDDYWPPTNSPDTDAEWYESINLFQKDLEKLKALAQNEDVDLHATVPSSAKHTFLRELLIVADHNAYHIGQLVYLRRLLGTWPPPAS